MTSKIVDRAIHTPTTRRLMAERVPPSRYMFHLNGADLLRLRASGVGDSASLAYALIRAAAYGERGSEWVILTGRVLEIAGRSYRWWYRATEQLAAGGLIDCMRHRGRAPRYRLRPPDGQRFED